MGFDQRPPCPLVAKTGLPSLSSLLPANRLAFGQQGLDLSRVIDDLLDGKSLLRHPFTPFFQGPRCLASLTKHVDPVKGGRPGQVPFPIDALVKGGLTQFDHSGREIWRSSITSGRADTRDLTDLAELDDWSGQAFSNAIAIMLDDWMTDLLQHLKIAGLLRPGASARQEAAVRAAKKREEPW